MEHDEPERYIPKKAMESFIKEGQEWLDGIRDGLYGYGEFNEEDFENCLDELFCMFQRKLPANSLTIKPDYMKRSIRHD